jgi:hypothetical protein
MEIVHEGRRKTIKIMAMVYISDKKQKSKETSMTYLSDVRATQRCIYRERTISDKQYQHNFEHNQHP